ncbi:MAG: hypothetical protein WAM91_07645 [Candidatus Acidiferrales bacterium]
MKGNWRGAIESAGERLRANPFSCLVLHFFRRFFTGDALSAEGDLRLGIGALLALLTLPGVFLPLFLLQKYSSFLRWLMGIRHFDYNSASIPDKYTLLTFTMVITGIVAVIKWDAIFPDRLDYSNLAPLPAGARRIFLAKFIALLLFVSLFAMALNAGSTILFPLVVMGNERSGGLWLRFVLAHVAATIAGSFFMFFFFAALMGLLMMFLPYRRFRQVSTGVQFVLVIALVMLLLFTPEIGAIVKVSSPGTASLLGWVPTVWFLGLYQQVFGRADAAFHALAARAVEGLTAAIGMSVFLFLFSYRRYFRRIPEMMETQSSGPGRIRRFASQTFARFALRGEFERACFFFAVKTLFRSQRHRLMMAGFTGLGLAIAVQDFASDWGGTARVGNHLPSAMLLSAPLAISFFLLSGLRFTFNVPTELRANWVFRMIPEEGGDEARRVARVMMLMFLLPIVVATLAVYSAFWGAQIGIAHTAIVLAASLVLVRMLLVGYRKIPFACSYATGRQNVGVALALYFLLFIFFSPSLAYLEYYAMSSPSVISLLALVVPPIAVWAGVHYYESEFVGEEKQLIFEDEPEPVVPSMELR